MSQRSKIPFLALAFALCLAWAPVGQSAQGERGFTAAAHQTSQFRGNQPEAGTWFWVKYFQCMVEETKGGADWATAGDLCEDLYPTDPPPTSGDPTVPTSPFRWAEVSD